MTDKGVIWVRPWANPQVPGGAWESRKVIDPEHKPYIPLARAQQLQQAMTVIAEGLEGSLNLSKTLNRPSADELQKHMALAIEVARKALTEFERKER